MMALESRSLLARSCEDVYFDEAHNGVKCKSSASLNTFCHMCIPACNIHRHFQETSKLNDLRVKASDQKPQTCCSTSICDKLSALSSHWSATHTSGTWPAELFGANQLNTQTCKNMFINQLGSMSSRILDTVHGTPCK